ncbi:hypothetical protein Clacol_008699 [Clathrus columnatus]|uniref:ABC transporter domain-containing protein n=1 Tax=Clathrus columnatus TaxID=1419009 RepID=A0AAV5ANM1_9AGAM|nr:hypothetical protein Clacol_008699 [Clathrus columnatus]
MFLVGRNGVGKSTLLRSIYDKTIPGLSKNLRILLLQQSYNTEQCTNEELSLIVLEYVVKSDKNLTETLRIRKSSVLKNVLENQNDCVAIAEAVRMLKHEMLLAELEEATKMAILRSGARGLKARKELLVLEEEVKIVEFKLALNDDEVLVNETDEAVSMLTELEVALENVRPSVGIGANI